MSWGYFLDFELTLPTADWDALQKTTGAGLPAQWWGFKEAGLEHTFGSAGFEDVTFKQVLGFFTHGESCQKTIVNARGSTNVHLIAHLDKSGDTQVAGPLAAMFEQAAKVGGTGRIRLVNDGSYSGEDGVDVTILDGRLVRSRIDGSNAIAQELGTAVYPDFEDEIEKYLSPEAKARSPKKAAPKKAAPKKAASKKAASKKAAPKKAAPKKAAPKKAASKKAASKKAAPKKAVSKKAASKKAVSNMAAPKTKKPAPKKAAPTTRKTAASTSRR